MNGLHGIIFAYAKTPGLRELTEERMPGSVPFGGRCRAVDFMLSNMAGAGITDVGVVLHGNYQSLLDHIGNGKTWDMARKYGGLRILPPFADTRAYRSGEFRGKMEALAGVRSYLQGIRQDYVVLSDSDLIINLPIADVFAAHLESGADITAVCTANGGFVDNATYLTLESDGAIGQVWCAPTTPRGHRSLEIYILSKQLLLTLVDECSAQDKYSFRRDVLAGMTGRLKLQSYVWDGYAAQLRSVQEYYDRSMELLQGSIRAELFAAARPILAKEDDEASSYFAPGSRVKNSLVADGCTIGPNSYLENVKVGENTRVNASQVYDSEIGSDTTVGPFAYVRPGSRIGSHVRCGDFVEVKNSTIGDGTKISHLTYIGDSDVGRDINFGCGTVTVNYDRVKKSRTVIDDNAFIGCNANLIAPVHIGEGAYIAAGSTVTDDVPPAALAIARARQQNKRDWANRHKLKEKK